MIEIKAPHDYSTYSDKHGIFLAGSIEMGKAEDWQKRVSDALSNTDALLLNPRRDDWDSSWVQSIDNEQFRTQVEWELAALERADTIVFYFQPGTQSPITLLEFGHHSAASPEKMIVCCPDGFWRKGNIDVTSARYGVRQVDTLDALIEAVRTRI
ncbi:MAG: nucleoside 2-deoxyribosyltransferase domain-containing protein [Alphaproteobacteria bacterium]|nr:nucleoside 2-deoxyribosyltransferase domain-containing protein [Alphaproteobacteria bacterium]